MLSGQSASDEQKGQSAIGISVRTKKSASAFSGGAMKPVIETSCPARDFTLSEKVRPRTPKEA